MTDRHWSVLVFYGIACLISVTMMAVAVTVIGPWGVTIAFPFTIGVGYFMADRRKARSE